jgi:hypothetical protein
LSNRVAGFLDVAGELKGASTVMIVQSINVAHDVGQCRLADACMIVEQVV